MALRANMIFQLDQDHFSLQSGGHSMELKREGLRWAMYTVNAAVRAYRRGFASPKYFDSLTEVEGAYKSWRGIATLHASTMESSRTASNVGNAGLNS